MFDGQEAAQLQVDVQTEILKIMSYFVPVLPNSCQLQALSCQYMSLLPFSLKQRENLEFVFKPSIVAEMVKKCL